MRVVEQMCPGFDGRDRARPLNFVSVGSDGRLLVCDDGHHCVRFLVPRLARMRRLRMRRLRIIVRLTAQLMALMTRATERVYTPGTGVGYLEARDEFELHSSRSPASPFVAKAGEAV